MKKQIKQMQFRQGDVWIESIKEPLPTTTKQNHGQKITLALGEASGHHHTLELDEVDSADWWKLDNGEQIVSLDKPTPLTHQEHAPITLPPGNYRVRIQREYSPQEIRRVAD